MAFNLMGTFQKNRRFWMASILMICMVSFVFCTGMKGDMSDRLIAMFSSRSGPAIVTIDGRNISSKDLHDLRAQRNLADAMMRICADIASKRVTKELFEMGKKVDQNQDLAKLQQTKVQLEAIRATLDLRKTRQRYFDIGVSKLDELIEFKLWQAEADRLGIYIDDSHLRILFREEFFQVISREEVAMAQREAMMRNFREANDAFVRRAVAEEFRVRIAQLAVTSAQPYSFFFRRPRQGDPGVPLKFDDPDMPNEIRAPLTLAQLWDFYKDKRAEFDVKLIPVHVQDGLAKIGDPNDVQKRKVFDDNKNKPNDPSSEDFGLEKPGHVQIEFVYADPMSAEYLGKAKAVAQLKVMNPIAHDLMQSPLVTAARYMAVAQKEQAELNRYYEAMVSKPLYHGAALFGEKSTSVPILARMASQHAQGVASLIGAAAFAPYTPLDTHHATAGFLAWGAMGAPALDKSRLDEFRQRRELEVQAAVQSEIRRRIPTYMRLFAGGSSLFPLDMAGPYLGMDDAGYDESKKEYVQLRPLYTPETVAGEIKDMLAQRAARERAQESMVVVRKELEKAAGDAEKFRRALNKLVPEHRLTYGPAADKKGTFYSRFTINDAPEFEILRNQFAKYTDRINMYEGRDVTPARVLKPADFWKMFFDGTESFAASSPHRAVPWPPEVRPDAARAWKMADRFLVNRLKITEEDQRVLHQHLAQHDPNLKAPPLDLFPSADLPILFWRSAELPPNRPADFDKVARDLQKTTEELKKIAADLQGAKDIDKTNALKKKQAELTATEADLQEIVTRVTVGWKFEEARRTVALPQANSVAKKLISNTRNVQIAEEEARLLKKDIILLPRLSQMHPDKVYEIPEGGKRVEYTLPPLPKDTVPYPREDMMKEVLSLFDMKNPITTGNKDLDDVNKELFDLVTKNDPDRKRPDSFVQILTNKPRSIYYVAWISAAPDARQEDFKETMLRATYKNMSLRDLFAERAQDETAKMHRANVLAWLQDSHKFTPPSDEARKQFDDRGVGD